VKGELPAPILRDDAAAYATPTDVVETRDGWRGGAHGPVVPAVPVLSRVRRRSRTLAQLIAEQLRRRPEGFDPAVVVCGILLGDVATIAAEKLDVLPMSLVAGAVMSAPAATGGMNA
jgi:hypothetical protein